MARADVAIDEYRERSTKLLDALNEVHDVLAVVEGLAADDAGRIAFFEGFFTNTPDYDMTSTTFFNSVVAWRALRTWLATAANYVPLNASRR